MEIGMPPTTTKGTCLFVYCFLQDGLYWDGFGAILRYRTQLMIYIRYFFKYVLNLNILMCNAGVRKCMEEYLLPIDCLLIALYAHTLGWIAIDLL